MIGESEVAEKQVVIKDLRSGAEQITIAQSELIAELSKRF